MINFFRRIRQKLLAENRFTRYLIYAVGEIALVMIGILLALQVNNWNEAKKTQQLDQHFLKNVQHELIQDTITFHERRQWYLDINHIVIQATRLLSSSEELNQSQIDTIRRSIGMVEILTPLYKNISKNNAQLANGGLERINVELSNEYNNYLEKYQSDFEVLSKFGNTLHNLSRQYLYPLVQYQQATQEWNVKSEWANIDIDRVQNNLQFINTYHRSVRWRFIYIDRLDNRIRDAKELLQIIDQHLEETS